MSRGGRGGGGSMMTIAGALGFQRGDMPTSLDVSEPPPIYPVLETLPLPRCDSEKWRRLGERHSEHVTATTESAYYIEEPSEGRKDIPRYTDKYKHAARPAFVPTWDIIPGELRFGRWVKRKPAADAKPKAKRPKLDPSAIGDLEERKDDDEEKEEEEEKDSDSDVDKKAANPDDPNAVHSDSDYEQEDNDYATNYFENGEDANDDDADNVDDDGGTF